MFRQRFANKVQKKFFYGWVIVALAGFSIFFSAPGQTYSISTFIDAYIVEFGFSRTQISSLYSTATLLSGTLLVFMGKATDRFGPRRMLIFVGLALSFATFFSSFSAHIWMIFVSFFMMRFFGQGSLSLIPGALVPQWFDKKKAFAFSLMGTGNILGNLFVPAMNTAVMQAFGWQNAWRLWSIMALVLFVPIVSLFVINKPEDIGLLPDNAPAKDASDIQEALETMARRSFTLQEALRTKEFWLIGLISMIMPLVNTGLMFHIFSILALKGMDATATAFAVGLFALPGFLMPFIAGPIVDRYRSKNIVMIMFVIITVNFIFFHFVNHLISASLFMMVLGLSINILGVTISVIWVKYFGRMHLGSIRGAATVFGVVGSALGPLPFGFAFDRTGNYTIILIIMACITFSGVIMAAFIKRPFKKHHATH